MNKSPFLNEHDFILIHINAYLIYFGLKLLQIIGYFAWIMLTIIHKVIFKVSDIIVLTLAILAPL